ncbi:hypothetical protein Q428_06790 [Fervidicella metallireducens AeB]|uniref:Putative Se/S carrier protein-like domain-containing protein n=1 Tax=Fervidicella metallireducens AeB TaxID=1403537 RepID=A0A017RV65_9CLOT|nr:DUF3343 domain-containing protein [Fervidicella metallireducens]EYE88658.1 hypothetical protein Q428_06790 [Fervidicella metallireducens AeB]
MEKYIVITFESINFAMQCEVVLKTEKIDYQIMPTPREITLSCGISIRTSDKYLDKVIELIKTKRIRNKDIYEIIGMGRQKTINKKGLI